MANPAQKSQTDLDLTDPNGPFAALFSGQPSAPSSDVPTPLLAPAGLDYAKSVAPPAGPTLGTEDQLQEPAEKASEPQNTGVAPSSITLRVPNTEDEGFLGKLKNFARDGGAARLVGSIGNALAMAAGTPEEKQIGAQSAEEQREFPLKLAQFNAEQRYRDAILGINQQKANTGQQNADTKTNVANNATIPVAGAKVPNLEADTAKKQYELEVMKQGLFPMDPVTANLINRPDLAGKPVSEALWKGANGVLQARGLKTVDLGAGEPGQPDSGGLWIVDRAGNKIHQISTVSPSLARSNSYLLRTQIPATDAQGNTTGFINPQTKTFTPINSIPGVSNAVGGNVIPPKPTGSVLTRGQVAQTILPQIPIIQNEISAASDKIGPGAGRWNEWWVNKAGTNDPEFAGLSQDLQLYATAVAMAHFGASAPQSYVDALMKDFGAAQSPENLAAKVEHAGGWIEGYANRVGGGNPKPNTSSSNNGKPLTAEEATAYLQKAGGDKNKARQLAKADGRSF